MFWTLNFKPGCHLSDIDAKTLLIIEGQERFPKTSRKFLFISWGGLGMLGGYVLEGRYARSSRYVFFSSTFVRLNSNYA